jgi:NAD(P)-dependent dehydrogenase (short-subunit alcohol dehydrogenase family)
MGERFKGKIVLVTGSAGGLGRDFALGLARESARLVLADVNEAGMQETAAALRAVGAESSVHRVDLAVESDIHAFAAEIARIYPRVDVLINNAGLAYGDIAFEFETLSQEKWLHFFSINTVAPLLLAHALREPLASGPGVIINQSSMASYMPGTAYGVTKAALNAMSYGMARSFAKEGIRVTSIAPGLMETPANRAGLPPEHYNHIQSLQLLKLHGRPDDITALALFLASDDARFITNEIVHCDAGHPFRGWRG